MLVEDYKQGTFDENAIFELRAKIEECFKIKYDFAGGIIFEIQKHHSPQSPNLQTIEPAVLPLNLVNEYKISQELAETFYAGLTISRKNELTIEEAILKPHSIKRFMFRPILVYNIGGEERALVGKEKFAESIMVLATNAIHWNSIFDEWLKLKCIQSFITQKGNEHDKILEDRIEEIGKSELIDFVGCGSTACWRGYKAYWELKNDSLFLIKTTSCHKDCGLEIQDANLKKMFGTNEVFAYWFNGKIVAPKGKLVQYIHMGYASIYEKELHFTFKNGLKIEEKLISNKKITDKINFQIKEREIAKIVQDTLFYYLTKNIQMDTLNTPLYNLCDDKYILTINKRGKIKKIWIDYECETFRDKIDEWWWNNTDDRKCRKSIKRAIKPLRLSYLDLPRKRFKISISFIYDRKTGKFELWKESWMNDE